MAQPCKTPAFWSVSCPHRRRFRVLARTLSKVHNFQAPLPTFRGTPDERFHSFKSFLSDGLEAKSHFWDMQLRRKSRASRLSVHFSLFLFRKTLPAKVPCVDSFIAKVSRPPSYVDTEFVEFCRKEVTSLFPREWDKRYDKVVQTASLSTSACAQTSRSRGGCRMYWLEKYGAEAREEFCASLLGKPVEFSSVPCSSLKAVDTGGKVRLLTVPPAQFSCLQPLHTIMYDHLSRFKWLLRGDAKAARFEDFKRVDGEVFVSGDYESATDSLNSHVQKEILQAVLDQASYVPQSIRGLAMDSLSSYLSYNSGLDPERVVRIENGQMMGFPLSFPLLCLVNYLAFRYATRGNSFPVRINGDDIVFRAPRPVAQRWMETVGKCGLTLSVGKTMIDRTFFSLNSALFKASGFKVSMVPFIRSKALFGKDDSAYSVPGRFRSALPGFTGTAKFQIQCTFLRCNVGYITKSRRSLNRGLGMNVPRPLLKASRLWSRECSLLSLPAEKPPPVPRSMWEKRPQGYSLERSEVKHIYTREEKNDLVEAMVNAAWEPSSDCTSYECEYDGGINVPLRDPRKLSKLARISLREYREIESLRNEEIFSGYWERRVRLHAWWCKKKKTTSADDEVYENFEEVKCKLGRGSVFDCRGKSDLKPIQLAPGCRVKLFRRGKGIGPPTCF
ncbi:RNA dependent RNA polymerase [Plasmopara viticola lesion associated ourmia-like virus 13]|uniref:RNA dependent RNA polymerase n=1 Tax=Plasmopara viticola lesion associated ourmia-like virus 13 TaxID=2686480 RepID=A0ABX6FQ46_9VIRU|nr:RNA dependent RNA polymerase [Plasmopara viticola lesion associated ourmia-like virus 13]QGY72543.1 RNA dependent RNA polymerase [Plasmopara viticola lesion associated ourmia-like virus 13]